MDTHTAPWARDTSQDCTVKGLAPHPADFDLEHEELNPDTGETTMRHSRVCSSHLAGYLMRATGSESVVTVEVYTL